MFDKSEASELSRLDFENFLWIVFIFLGIGNILGDINDQEYIKTKDQFFEKNADKIFEFTLTITFFIYIYFFIRNYAFYKRASIEEKNDLFIKLLGSTLLLVGVVCLIYFQLKDSSFEGTPAI